MNATATHGRGEAQRLDNTIVADVLDAWFAPSPAVRDAYLAGVGDISKSPDPACRPLIQAIATARILPENAISLGAGSSEIIHRVLPAMTGPGPAVILDPTYSEYSYVLERSGREVIRHKLSPTTDFAINTDALKETAKGASLVILVNPNNPTGKALTRNQILELRANLDPKTVLWVDEAYVEYIPESASVELEASQAENLFVLKSLSKAYALSGLRAAYLVGPNPVAPPPWIVSAPAQQAAIAAFSEAIYYEARWRETNRMTEDFASLVRALGLKVHCGFLNAILIESPKPDWAIDLAENGLIVRTPEGMGDVLKDRYIRIGLKPRDQWSAILGAIKSSSPGTARNDNMAPLVLYS